MERLPFFRFIFLVLLISLPIRISTAQQDEFLDELAERTYAYLGSDWATSQHLPWSWRSETLSGGDYANTTEIALLMMSHLGAYDMARDWSPSWATVSNELEAILDQLLAWQTDSQASQPHGPNAYQHSAFYQWYWINWNPPVVGAGDGDKIVPSIDNAFLAAALITLRSYATAHGHTSLATKASAILTNMDFRMWWEPTTSRFYLGASNNPAGGVPGDLLSNENRITNFVARALNHISAEEFSNSLDALVQNSSTYDRNTTQTDDDIRVQRVAWDGSYFTYTAPGLFIREIDTEYANDTLIPATWAQIAYAMDENYSFWGLSDVYDIGSGGYLQQGGPPAADTGRLQSHIGVVTPHASAMALVTPYRNFAIENLYDMTIQFPNAFHPSYGFSDSIMADPASAQFGQTSDRFSSIAQGWLFLSIVNAEAGTLWNYFYQDAGVNIAHSEFVANLTITMPKLLPPPRPILRDVSDVLVALGLNANAILPAGTVYQIERTTNGNSVIIGSVPVGTSTYVDSNLTCSTSYRFRVRSYDVIGNVFSDWSPYLDVVTAQCVDALRQTFGLYADGQWLFYVVDGIHRQDIRFVFGPTEPGWLPIAGDWTGDGIDGIGVYKSGTFILRSLTSDGVVDDTLLFGPPSDALPVVGDWNGDGIDTVGIFVDGAFELRNSNSSGNADWTFELGNIYSIPISGDWNNNGTDSVGYVNGNRFYLASEGSNPTIVTSFDFGPEGWLPIAGDWNDDLVDSIGLFHEGLWRLRNNNSAGIVDYGFSYGDVLGIWKPISFDDSVEVLNRLFAATVPQPRVPIIPGPT